jgi:hypothetical protein
MAAIAPKIVSRAAFSSGSISLVSHVYAAHAHHSAASTMTARATPCQVVSSASIPVTCVIAKTKTRSKNSSSGVTRCSDSAASRGSSSASVTPSA